MSNTTPPEPRGVESRDIALGACGIALGIAVAIGASQFPGGSAYDVLGPKLMPYLIAAGLVATGASILIGALRGAPPGAEREPLALPPILYVALALIVPMVAIRPFGWVPTCAVVFALGARAFNSRRPILDLAIGAVLGGVTLTLFNEVLGLSLPIGWLFFGTGG